jgi:hypothetical protein
VDDLIRVYDDRQGVASSLVSWAALTREALETVGRYVPAEHAARIFDRLAKNPGLNGSGMPDLLLFPPADKPGYRLVEVKGPGDRLQPNQGRWLGYLRTHGIPSVVVHVRRSRDPG